MVRIICTTRYSATYREYEKHAKLTYGIKKWKETTEEKFYTYYLLPVVMYAWQTWSTTQSDEEKVAKTYLKGNFYGKYIDPHDI